jgi:hypothetical protein
MYRTFASTLGLSRRNSLVVYNRTMEGSKGSSSELQELTCFGSGDTGDAFTSFVEARWDTGRPVIPTRR